MALLNDEAITDKDSETLAFVWPVKSFVLHEFGKDFELLTDNKPIEFLLGPKTKINVRIER